jgi:hypothetical protein
LKINMSDPEEHLTPAEVAKLAKLTVGTLATMRCQKRGPDYTKLSPTRSGRVRYKRRDVEAWLNGRTEAAG